MTATVTIAGADASRRYSREQFDAISIELAAFDGDIGISAIPVPDPAGADAVATGRRVLIADGAFVALDGFIGTRNRERGAAVAPPNLLNVYQVQDANVLLTGMVVEKWARPAETDVARVLAAAAAWWPSLDTTWVLATNPVDLPPKTFDTDAFAEEFVGHLVEWTGKTLFVHTATASVRHLHFHALSEGHLATITLTDGAADLSASFPISAPNLERDGLDVRNKVVARGPSGASVTVSDATSIAAHDADGRKHEALASFDADDTTELTALANRMLATQKDDRDTWHATAGPFTSTTAAAIGPGYLIDVTSAVLGATATRQRIAHLTWRYQHPATWWADLELGHPIRLPKPPAAKPGAGPCTDTAGSPLVASTEQQVYVQGGGVRINDTGGGAQTLFEVYGAGVDVGWAWDHTTVILGWACPAGVQYHTPREYHLVMRFDTTAAVRTDCTSGAQLSFAVDPDCACGPYDLVSGAYWSSGLASNMTVARFRQGKVITRVDLSHDSTVNAPTVVTIPPQHVNYGGLTTLALRPAWSVAAKLKCSASLPPGDQSGSTHCSSADADITLNHLITAPQHWLQPGNVHEARLKLAEMTPLLSGLTLSGSGCLTDWMTAKCATSSDDAHVPADNCKDECCATWWKVCAAYRPGTLQVMVGGRPVPRRDFWEHHSRTVFRLRVGSCEAPRYRMVVAG